jgi:hypothetical protein
VSQQWIPAMTVETANRIHDLIFGRAARTPSAEAVVDGDRR